VFMLACGFAAFAIVPVSLTKNGGPTPHDAVTMSLRDLYRIAPIGVVGVVGAGLINTAMTGLIPVYGLQTGIPAPTIPLLIVASQIGTMALQWPLGWLSDRTDRRYVIALATGGGGLAPLLLTLSFGADPLILMVLFALWGGFSLSIYSVCIAHAGDYAAPSQLVPLVSSLMLAWAVGSIIGPNLATLSMEYFGPRGLMYYVAAISFAVGLFAVWRITRRPPLPPERRDAFRDIPATSPVAAELAADSGYGTKRGD